MNWRRLLLKLILLAGTAETVTGMCLWASLFIQAALDAFKANILSGVLALIGAGLLSAFLFLSMMYIVFGLIAKEWDSYR